MSKLGEVFDDIPAPGAVVAARAQEGSREGDDRSEHTNAHFFRTLPPSEGTDAVKAEANFGVDVLEASIPGPRDEGASADLSRSGISPQGGAEDRRRAVRGPDGVIMEPLLPVPYLPNLDSGLEHRLEHRPIDAGCVRPRVERGFRDRREAGRGLARALAGYAGRSDVRVLALPSGGVPVAYEVALALGAPLEMFPGHKPGGPPPALRGQTVILVDDGLAAPGRVRSTAVTLRQIRPGRLVVAVPAAAPEALAAFADEVDEVVCARTPEPFYAAGLCYLWYRDPTPTSDEEVRDLLADFAPTSPAPEVR
jgi:putative phosphoribosyl transferase